MNMDEQRTGRLPLQALQKYADINGLSQNAPHAGPRAQAYQAVVAAPDSAEAWWTFLYNEEIARNSASSPKDASVSLLDVYRDAVESIPRQKYYDNDVFVRVWVGYARQQWRKSPDDARDTFKALRSQHIGEKSALMYHEWASLEASNGDAHQALSILKKGGRANAEPESLLKSLEQSISSGQFNYLPFWTCCPMDKMMTSANNNTVQTLSKAFTDGGSSSEDATATVHSLNLTARLNSGSLLLHPNSNADAMPATVTPLVRQGSGLTNTNQLGSEIKPGCENTASKDGSVLKPRKFGAFGKAVRVASIATVIEQQHEGNDDSHSDSPGSSGDDADMRKRKAEMAGATELDGKRRPPLPTSTMLDNTTTTPMSVVPSVVPTKTVSFANNNTSTNTLTSTMMDGLVDYKSKTLTPIPESSSLRPLTTAPMSIDGSVTVTGTTTTARRQIILGDVATPRQDIKLATYGGNAGGAMAPSTGKLPSVPRPPLSQSKPVSLPPAASHGGQQIVLGRDGSIVNNNNVTNSHTAAVSTSTDGGDISNEPTAPLQKPATLNNNQQLGQPASTPMSVTNGQVIQGRGGVYSTSKPKLQIDAAGNIAMTGGKVASGRPAALAVPSDPSLGSQQQQQQQPSSSSSGRRVIEDENSIYVRNICYTKLECVGRGGSSKVYKVMAPNKKIFALKRIRLNGRDTEAAAGFMDEITLLNKLKGKQNIIQLIDAEVHQNEGIIYMVLEYGDIDLARLLQRHSKSNSGGSNTVGNGPEVDENFIRLYWDQMLYAVDMIHEERIVHSDLKPANFLIVEGQLKLIDFGIAKAIQSDTTSIARESQVGTLNYMSPEAILGGNSHPGRGGAPMKVGRASDIWSLGCILYQMVYGHTPFSHLPFIQKMQAIINPNYEINFPPLRNLALLDVMKRCLDRDPKTRISMKELRQHGFLRPTENKPAVSATPHNSVELSKEQLQKLLFKLSQAGTAPGDVDIQHLSEQLFSQLSSGTLSPDIIAKKRQSKINAAAQQQHGVERGIAAFRGSNGMNTSLNDGSNGGVQKRAPLMPIGGVKAPLQQVQQPEQDLGEALRQGLQRFTFDDETS